MVLLNNNFEYKVDKVISDTNGNFIILDINLEGKKFKTYMGLMMTNLNFIRN